MTRFAERTRLLCLSTGIALLSACQPAATNAPAEGDGRFLGAVRADVSSFTLTPDGCGASVMFDDFAFPSHSGPAQGGGRKHERSISFALAPVADGAQIKVYVRGNYDAAGTPGSAPTLTVRASGKSFPTALPDGTTETAFEQRFDVPIAQGAKSADIAFEAAGPAGGGAISVETADIILVAGKGCAAPPEPAPATAPKKA